MKTKNRWLDWIVTESETLDVELPWSRTARVAKAETVQSKPLTRSAAAAS